MFRFTFTRHVIEQARAKGFTPEELHAACYVPSRTSDVRAHPGQRRFIAGRVVVVAEPIGPGEWCAITCYLDGVVTPVRPDQLNTPEGRRFATYGRGARNVPTPSIA